MLVKPTIKLVTKEKMLNSMNVQDLKHMQDFVRAFISSGVLAMYLNAFPSINQTKLDLMMAKGPKVYLLDIPLSL